MHVLTKRLKDAGISLVLIEMKKNGDYIPEWKTIFVNQALSEDNLKLAILHEFKNALDHDEFSDLYKNSVYHSKMENQANSFMLSEIIKDYEGYYNNTKVANEFKLGIGSENLYINFIH